MKRFLYFLAVLSICFVSTKVWGQVSDTPIQLRWDNNGQALKGDFVLIGNLRKVGGSLINVSNPAHTNRPTMNASAATLKIQSHSS